ncbi:MAG: DUF4129 domain-containing protein [Chloroflexota bacterium]
MWAANLPTQRLLTLGMFGCVSWAFTEMTLSLGQSWPNALATAGLAFAVFAAGIALGGREEGRAYRKYTDYSLIDWALLLIPIVLILKLLPFLLEGLDAVAAEVSLWSVQPWRFWDVTLVWSLLLIFFVWDHSVRIAEQLGRLSFQPAETEPSPVAARNGLPPAEIEGVYAWSRPAAGTDERAVRPGERGAGAGRREWRAGAGRAKPFRSWDRSPYRFTNHARAWGQLMWSFIGGGFFVIIFAGLALVSPAELGDPTRTDVVGVIPSVLLYYVLGLVLASQTSLDRLRAEWLRAGAQVQPGLARKWLSYGIALMAAALLLALLFPTRFVDDSGFGSGAGGVLGLITAPLRFFFGGIFGVLSWVLAHVAAFLFAPIASLLPRGSGGTEGAMRPPPAVAPPGGAAPLPSLIGQLVWGFLFYVVPAALAAYALWNTWKKRDAIWNGVREFFRDVFHMLWGAILDAAAAVWRLFGALSPRLLRAAPAAIRKRWKQRPRLGALGDGSGWLRLRGLSPRELIQYFYVSLVQRAESIGWQRRAGQTAYEYSRELAERLPERAGEVAALTDAFVHAKYSRREVREDDARRARRPWQRLRGELQLRRRADRLASWFGLSKH